MNGFQSLSNLTQLDKVPIDMTLEGLQAYHQGQRADQIGLQELMRKQAFEQSADPMRLQDMQTSNRRGLQDLAIGAQDLQKRTRENREGDFTSDARMQAEYKGFLAKASEADISMAASKFQEMAFSRDPKIKAQGIAGMQMTKDFVMQKQREDNLRAIAQGNNATSIRVAEIGAAARTAAKASSAKAEPELVAKLGYEKVSVYYDAKAREAEIEGDADGAKYYAMKADQMKQAAERARILAAQQAGAGKVDMTGATDGRIPVQPGAKPEGFTRGPALGTKENPIKLD